MSAVLNEAGRQGNKPADHGGLATTHCSAASRIAYCEKLIAATAPFIHWPAPAQRELAKTASIDRYPRGAVLTRRSQPLKALLLIAEGSVDCRISGSHGKQFVMEHALRGWAFGLIPLLDGDDLPHDLVAADDVTVVRLPFSVIHQQLEHLPALWASVATEIARRYRNQLSVTAHQTFDAPHLRLARILLALARDHGQWGDVGVQVQVRLSQELLGSSLGMSRQAAIPHLRNLIDRGLIDWSYGRATVLDLPGLQALVDSEGVKV